MRKALGVGVLIIVVVGFKLANRSSDDKQVLKEMRAMVGRIASTPEETAYLNRILDREHTLAFDEAYSDGGRRRSAQFDEDKYVAKVIGAMVKQCEKDKKTDLAGRLRSVLEVSPAPGS